MGECRVAQVDCNVCACRRTRLASKPCHPVQFVLHFDDGESESVTMGLSHWLQLSLTPGLGPILIRRMIEFAGSAEKATELRQRELQQIEGIGMAKGAVIASGLVEAASEVAIQRTKAAEMGARVICPEDADWPVMLRPLRDAPTVLFIAGAFEPRDLQALAI